MHTHKHTHTQTNKQMNERTVMISLVASLPPRTTPPQATPTCREEGAGLTPQAPPPPLPFRQTVPSLASTALSPRRPAQQTSPPARWRALAPPPWERRGEGLARAHGRVGVVTEEAEAWAVGEVRTMPSRGFPMPSLSRLTSISGGTSLIAK